MHLNTILIAVAAGVGHRIQSFKLQRVKKAKKAARPYVSDLMPSVGSTIHERNNPKQIQLRAPALRDTTGALHQHFQVICRTNNARSVLLVYRRMAVDFCGIA